VHQPTSMVTFAPTLDATLYDSVVGVCWLEDSCQVELKQDNFTIYTRGHLSTLFCYKSITPPKVSFGVSMVRIHTRVERGEEGYGGCMKPPSLEIHAIYC